MKISPLPDNSLLCTHFLGLQVLLEQSNYFPYLLCYEKKQFIDTKLMHAYEGIYQIKRRQLTTGFHRHLRIPGKSHLLCRKLLLYYVTVSLTLQASLLGYSLLY